jgi:hypothetical protein
MYTVGYTPLLSIIGVIFLIASIGVIGPLIVDFIYLFRKEELYISVHEQKLMEKYATYFNMRIMFSQMGKSVDFETKKLNEISEELKKIRSNKKL